MAGEGQEEIRLNETEVEELTEYLIRLRDFFSSLQEELEDTHCCLSEELHDELDHLQQDLMEIP